MLSSPPAGSGSADGYSPGLCPHGFHFTFAVSVDSRVLFISTDLLQRGELEALPDGAPRLNDGHAAGHTISLYPAATRRELIKLLAVWLLFVVVRNNIAGPAPLARLSIAMLINGSLLGVFALVQFFSSPAHMVYWSYPTLGQVFGPFSLCLPHSFPDVNMAIGVLLALRRLRRRRSRNDEADEPAAFLRTLLRPFPLIRVGMRNKTLRTAETGETRLKKSRDPSGSKRPGQGPGNGWFSTPRCNPSHRVCLVGSDVPVLKSFRSNPM